MRKNKFDVILMDMQMPVMDGITATEELHARYDKKDLPKIIALTANVFLEDRNRCIEAGMDDFLSKPINKEKLVGALSGIASKTQVVEDVAAPVIDRDKLFAQFAGDEDILAELIEDFAQACPQILEDLRNSIKKKDFEQWEITAHTVKGLVGNFFVAEVKELAYIIEKKGHNKDNEEVLQLWNQLKEKLEKLIVELKNLSKENLVA